jgi:hypothetical protein
MYEKTELEMFLEQCVGLPEMGYYDYEWERFVSYYDPQSGMFYWMSGSGCSCNYLEEDYKTVSDLSVGRKDEFLSAASYFGDGGVYGYGQGRYSDQFEKIRQAVTEL